MSAINANKLFTIRTIAVLKKVRYALCPMPYALCPMPYALCPMPYALCPMPYALCPVVPHLSEKGYIFINVLALTASFAGLLLLNVIKPLS
jgi:hypothetical protein